MPLIPESHQKMLKSYVCLYATPTFYLQRTKSLSGLILTAIRRRLARVSQCLSVEPIYTILVVTGIETSFCICLHGPGFSNTAHSRNHLNVCELYKRLVLTFKLATCDSEKHWLISVTANNKI